MAEELEFCGAECHLSDVYGGALLAVCEWLCLLLSVVFLRAGLLCYVSVNSCRALPGPPLSPCAVYPSTTPQHSTAQQAEGLRQQQPASAPETLRQY